MTDPSSLVVYVLALLALLAVPGPSVSYVVGLSLRQGRRAGGIYVGLGLPAATGGPYAPLARGASGM
jgi:threonine/homoserine/homoserine lactone efflux protein